MGTGIGDGNGWEQWKNAIFIALEDQKKCNEEINHKIELLTQKINDYVLDFKVHEREMKIKSGTWGLIGGTIPIIVILGIYIIEKLGSK